VPLALMLTACNGDDRKPSASLPNNPGQPSQPNQPSRNFVTASVNNDDLAVAEANGTKIATSSVSSLRATRGEPAVVATQSTVDVQFDGANDQATKATLTVDGQTYQLAADGRPSIADQTFSGQADDGTGATLDVLRAGNQQSAVLAYFTGDATETRAGFASYGALTPENRVPDSNSATATYTGTTVLAVANQQRTATLQGEANVIANFGAGAADRFNGSTFELNDGSFQSASGPGGAADGGTLTVRDGSSAGSGNAFSAGLSASGFENSIGSGASGSMAGNFFGDNAEEVAGTIAVSGGASGTNPGYTGIGGFVGRDAGRAAPNTAAN
jgi:hypothetical protein